MKKVVEYVITSQDSDNQIDIKFLDNDFGIKSKNPPPSKRTMSVMFFWQLCCAC